MSDETRALLREQLENDHPDTIICMDCEEPLYEGETYYEVGDQIICEECIKGHKHCA